MQDFCVELCGQALPRVLGLFLIQVLLVKKIPYLNQAAPKTMSQLFLKKVWIPKFALIIPVTWNLEYFPPTPGTNTSNLFIICSSF